MIYKHGEFGSFTMLNLALHIVYVAAECKVDTIIDLGSHQGHLISQLARLTEGIKLVGYEALSENCEKAVSKGTGFTVNHATIVPDGVTISHLHRTEETWSGSLASSIYRLTDHDQMVEAGPNIEVSALCETLRNQPQTFLKVNIEGVDVSVVDTLLAKNIKPKALMFELMDADRDTSKRLFAQLSDWYYIPKDLTHSGCASYCFSNDSGFVKTLTDTKSGIFKTFRR